MSVCKSLIRTDCCIKLYRVFYVCEKQEMLLLTVLFKSKTASQSIEFEFQGCCFSSNTIALTIFTTKYIIPNWYQNVSLWIAIHIVWVESFHLEKELITILAQTTHIMWTSLHKRHTQCASCASILYKDRIYLYCHIPVNKVVLWILSDFFSS